MSSYSEGLCVSHDVEILPPILGPKEVCALRGSQIPGLGMNGKPWSNHMSSAGNAFLVICGLSIWAPGDGIGLDQGGGKGPRGDPRPWARQEL